MSPRVHFKDGQEIEYRSISIKVSGWVKCRYKNGDVEETEHYPPEEILKVDGGVNYQSPHGRI